MATPAAATRLGHSPSSGMAARVVMHGTAAVNSEVVAGPSAATARV
ncbi:MAG TPA: hypothetical protein VMW18_03760 [Candidatus Binatia bacterium]|nr:hypothetical protein [Candidatus Binatia bacterium]